jgi:ribosomal protein S6
MLYEINYLVLQSKTADLEKIRGEMKKIVESFDAKVTAEREYLKRKLSYEITHERYGFFTVLRFEIKDNNKIQELKKNLNIDENVSRYIIVRADELPSLEEHAKIEADVQRKDTLKQEEVEQALAKEAKKTPETAPAKEEVKKEETADEIKEETKEEVVEKKPTSAKTTAGKEDKKKVEEDLPKEKENKKEIVEKEEEKEDTVEANEKEADKKDEEGKVSLDELDKKLDEILNL